VPSAPVHFFEKRTMTYRRCSFCGTLNAATERYCGCGHEAHAARLACRCPTCRRAAFERSANGSGSNAEQISTLADSVAEALADIERRQREGQ
jgi:hypothetical protein